LQGQTLTVFRKDKQDRGELFFCYLASGRLVGIPAWMTDPACAAYSLGTPVISVEALLALREFLAAIRSGDDIRFNVADNRPVQEEGHEKIRTTTSGLAVESAPSRYGCSADSRTAGTGAGPDGTADSGGLSDNGDSESSKSRRSQ
jgi:hypothetical protein